MHLVLVAVRRADPLGRTDVEGLEDVRPINQSRQSSSKHPVSFEYAAGRALPDPQRSGGTRSTGLAIPRITGKARRLGGVGSSAFLRASW
jgi:hypothetical protein